MTDIRTTLKQGLAQLREAHVPSHTLAVELLLLHVLGRDRAWLYSHPEEEISSADAERFFALITRRSGGEPTQHLTGKQEFWGLEFEVNPDVLIPRPETEHVIEVALDRLGVREIRAGRKPTLSGEGLQIADIGTGSGCIAVALAKELPGAKFYATDISPKALDVARRNAARHGVMDRIDFIEGNLLDQVFIVGAQLYPERSRGNAAPLLGKDAPHESPARPAPDGVVSLPAVAGYEPARRGGSRSFDVIVSNPPYVGRREAATLPREVREHDPEVALYGGEEGYELYAALIAQAAQHLKPGGILVLELGHNSLSAVQTLLDAANWTNVSVTNDLAGIPRVLAAEKL